MAILIAEVFGDRDETETAQEWLSKTKHNTTKKQQPQQLQHCWQVDDPIHAESQARPVRGLPAKPTESETRLRHSAGQNIGHTHTYRERERARGS